MSVEPAREDSQDPDRPETPEPERRLLDDRGRPYFDLQYYAVAKDGRYAGACAYQGSQFAVADARGARLEEMAYLFKREERPSGRPISGTLVDPR